MSGLNGWHPGERSIQQKLGIADEVAIRYTAIQGDLPHEHAQFYETCLPFIPVATLGRDGRPWGSILAKNGAKGFMRNRQYTKLDVKAETWDGDPLTESIERFNEDGNMLIAGIGVEFTTRRRNKFAGVVSELNQSGHNIEMELLVNEAIGYVPSLPPVSHTNEMLDSNCPKYINVRDLEPNPERNVNVVHSQLSLSTEDRLPDDVIDFILARDTVFLGTSYVPTPEVAPKFPPHLGMNHRGGLPGFIRVRKDGRTLVLPDYSGASPSSPLLICDSCRTQVIVS
jgi:predicted pyridoxine 5'-phosphate oxidase superfamily flavin-nucleotide-binding protein